MPKRIIVALCLIMSFLISCKAGKCVKNDEFKTKIEVSNECSIDDRKTVESITGLQGIIKAKTSSVYLIEANNGLKYFACNLPDSIKKEGTKVYFCGEKKQEKPTEKVIANLLKITSLYVK